MSRWGPPVRTQADKMRDVDLFLVQARPDRVVSITADELASRYGVNDLKAVEYKLVMAQQRVAAR